MNYAKILYFSAGVLIGAIVATIYADVKKDEAKKPEVGGKKTSENDDDEEIKYKETSSLDDYEAFKAEEMTKYSELTKLYDVDPAETESPTDEELEAVHDELRHRPPIEISATEYGTFGYDTQEFYYNPEYNVLWEDGEETLDDDDTIHFCGNLLESGFEEEGKTSMYIRNFRLQMDIKVMLYSAD